MRFFLDTEFIESGPWEPIHLLSIGVVCEDDREFYAVHRDAPLAAANEWVKQNVFPHLHSESYEPYLATSLHRIRDGLLTFCDPQPEFWGYYADYDWVVFCQIFGTMMDLPKGWPMYCRDLKQWCDDQGNPELPKQETAEHNALNGARWNRDVWRFLRTKQLAHVADM